MRVFLGSYSEYKAAKDAERQPPPKSVTPPVAPRHNMERSRPRSSMNNIERRRLARVKEIEGKIADLEGQLSAVSRQLENPPADPARVQRLGSDYLRLQSDLEGLLGEWESLQE